MPRLFTPVSRFAAATPDRQGRCVARPERRQAAARCDQARSARPRDRDLPLYRYCRVIGPDPKSLPGGASAVRPVSVPAAQTHERVVSWCAFWRGWSDPHAIPLCGRIPGVMFPSLAANIAPVPRTPPDSRQRLLRSAPRRSPSPDRARALAIAPLRVCKGCFRALEASGRRTPWTAKRVRSTPALRCVHRRSDARGTPDEEVKGQGMRRQALEDPARDARRSPAEPSLEWRFAREHGR